MIGISLCREILLNKDRFLLYSHKNPDGDTVCSCAALCSALRRVGKTAYLAPNDQVIDRYRNYFDPFVMPESYAADYFISVDVASLNQMPESYGGHTDMIIDHHPSNSLFADLALVNGSKAACGEIVMELIKELCGDITPFEAEMLYVAVSTDTGCFRYANTNADCLRSAAELLDLGVNNGRINVGIFMKMTKAKMKLVGRIYSTLETRKDGLISVVKITDKMIKETGVTENDLEDLAGLLHLHVAEEDGVRGGAVAQGKLNHERRVLLHVGVVLGVVVSPPAPATSIGRPASTVVVVGELFGIGAF